MADATQGLKKPRFSLPTPAWISIIVGVSMLFAGIVFSLDARGYEMAYEKQAKETAQNTADIKTLLNIAAVNQTHIGTLTESVKHLQELLEQHVIKDRAR